MKAQDYKKKAQGNDLVYDLPMDTPDCIWKVRKFPIEQFLLAGKLPTFLASKIKKAAIGEDIGEVEDEKMSEQEYEETLSFTKQAIEYIAVEPRVSANPQTDDEIGHEDITKEDFAILQNWAVGGGAAEAEKFRSERYAAFVDSLSKSEHKNARRRVSKTQ